MPLLRISDIAPLNAWPTVPLASGCLLNILHSKRLYDQNDAERTEAKHNLCARVGGVMAINGFPLLSMEKQRASQGYGCPAIGVAA